MDISAATPDERAEAVSLLLAEVPSEWHRLLRGQFLDQLASGELHPEGLLVLRARGRLRGAMLLQRIAGNVAIIGLPYAPALAEQTELVRAAIAKLHEWQTSYAQASLLPQEFRYGPALLAGGLKYLTQLEFYARSLAPRPWQPPNDLTFHPVTATSQQEFLDTLFQTYLDTLDSPELNGTRTPSEVLEEYRAFSYSPPAWWLVRQQRQAVGVVILAPGSEQACELSYLGLVPAARGRRLGRQLLRFAETQALKFAPRLILSVDERNTPARQLYLREGYLLERIRRIYWFCRGQSK